VLLLYHCRCRLAVRRYDYAIVELLIGPNKKSSDQLGGFFVLPLLRYSVNNICNSFKPSYAFCFNSSSKFNSFN
jgi:hypothetical protein